MKKYFLTASALIVLSAALMTFSTNPTSDHNHFLAKCKCKDKDSNKGKS